MNPERRDPSRDALPHHGGAALYIVDEVAGKPWPARLPGAVRTLAGYLLMFAGVVLGIPALAMLILVPLATFTGDADIESWLMLAGVLAAAALPLWLGRRLARGRRRLVLFLRRFGFNDATQALTHAVTGALGSRWRLVTLDDTLVEAVGVHRMSMIGWGIGRWLSFGALVLAAGFVVAWWFGDGLDNLIGGILDQVVEGAAKDAANPLEAIAIVFVTIIVGAMVAIAVAGILIAIAILGLATLGTASLAMWRTERAVRQAEGEKALALRDADEVVPAIDRLGVRAGHIQAPRLTVLKVDDVIWRDVVRELADESAVAIVDISEPSDHLIWEVDLLGSGVRASMLLIGRRDLVEALADGREASSAADRLRVMLAGHEVLTYDSLAAPRTLRRFASSLSAALDRIERRQPLSRR